EAAVISSCDLFASEAVVSPHGFDYDGGLGSNGSDQLELIFCKCGKWIESVSVNNAVDACLGHKRRTDRRTNSLRDDRLRSAKLLVVCTVLRQQRDLFAHHFLRDRPADSERFG